jgi:hypothetical protein
MNMSKLVPRPRIRVPYAVAQHIKQIAACDDFPESVQGMRKRSGRIEKK